MAFGLEMIMKNRGVSQAPQSPYDIRGAGNYGLKMFDPSKTRSMLDNITQRQIDKDTGRQFRQGVVGGDFNPEVSAYNATQSARDSRDRALVDLDKYAHEDQYKLLQGMLGIDSNKLNRENLDFMKYQYEDGKPGFWTGLTDIMMGGLNAVLPFEEGGVIPSTDKVYETGGVIPADMANIPPMETSDNTLIRAKTGEGILTDDTTRAIGGESGIQNLNKIGEVLKMFTPDFASKIGATAGSAGGVGGSMAMGGLGSGGNVQAFNPSGNNMMDLGQRLGGAIKGMFGGGGGSASMPQAFEAGGVTGSDPLQQLMQEFQLAKQNVDQYVGQGSSINPEMANMLRQKMIDAERKLRMYQQQNMQAKQTNTGDVNGNGIPDNQEQTIMIKTKPVQPKSAPANASMQLPPMDNGGGAYINSGFERPLG